MTTKPLDFYNTFSILGTLPIQEKARRLGQLIGLAATPCDVIALCTFAPLMRQVTVDHDYRYLDRALAKRAREIDRQAHAVRARGGYATVFDQAHRRRIIDRGVSASMAIGKFAREGSNWSLIDRDREQQRQLSRKRQRDRASFRVLQEQRIFGSASKEYKARYR